MEWILYCIIIVLLLVIVYLYWRTVKTLRRLDEMMDQALNNTFCEANFTESKLSRLEAKLYRYLLSGVTSRRQIKEEKNAIQILVSDISHQTKTPLANVLLYAELLAEAPELSADSKQLAEQIENQAAKLNFLIQSLVKTSRLENGIVAVQPKENSIRELLQTIDYAATAKEHGITLLVYDIPDLYAVFDLKWTREAIANIIDNALKYTPRGGSVSICVQNYEMFVRVDISDTGIGITEEESAKIFGRFYRSPRVAEKSGVGIGLYLAREIIHQEGGYIKVTSEVGKGSVFSIFLSKQQNLAKL